MKICSVQVNPGQHVKGVHEIIPLQALKEISERLPQTEEELRRYNNHMFASHKLISNYNVRFMAVLWIRILRIC
jgi:hypothetical protein